MSDYFACTPVELEFLQQTKNIFRAEEIVRATPDQIFDVFEDAHSWTVWAMPIQHVEWTSPKPFGVGTTRPVTRFVNKRMFRRFAEYTEERVAAVDSANQRYQCASQY